MFKTIPVVAGWTAAAEAAKLEHIDFSVTAFQARNKDHTPAAGSFKEQLLKDLEAQVKAGGGDTLGRIDEKTNQYVYLRAIRLDESCMLCHGDPARYDAKDEHGAFDGKDPLGFAMESWKPGDMHGAFEVSMPLSTVDAQVAGFFQNGLIITIPLLIVAAGVFIFIIRHLLTKPVAAMVQTMNQIISTHDLTRRLDIKRGDEVGQIGHWFDELVGSLHKIISDVLSSTRQVAAASTQIAASSEEMAAGLTRQEQQAGRRDARHRRPGGPVGAGRHRAGQAERADRPDHRGHQRDRRADQPARPQRRHRGRPRRRARPRLRRRRRRSPQARRTHHPGHRRGRPSIREIQAAPRPRSKIDAGAKRVNSGVELANSAGEALSRIVLPARRASAGMIQSIAAAAEEQSAASEQISRSVEQITAVTKESAEGASQAARAAADLSAQAERLQELVAKFKV
jgi:methyl-accepting chemotaxis protein